MSLPEQSPETRYVCSSCGGGTVEVNDAHPSLDDRYPVGHCVTCTPWPKPKKHPFKNEWIQPPRKTIALVSADVFDPDDFAHRREVERQRRLAKRLTDPKSAAKLSEAEREEASQAIAWLTRSA